jgi:hypothetical protein
LGFCETPQAFRSKKVRVLSIIATPHQKSPVGAFLVGGRFRKKPELILNKIPTAPPDDEVGWSAEGAESSRAKIPGGDDAQTPFLFARLLDCSFCGRGGYKN